MKWTKISVGCKTDEIDKVGAILSMIDSGLEIEDFSDIEENLMTVYGELIDEKILNSDRTHAKVSIYVSNENDVGQAMGFIKEKLTGEGLDGCPVEVLEMDEEDWANNWKQYYKPQRAGRHLLITPPWEKCDPEPDDKVILMDPGMAFGTGTHETTRLCLALLERHLRAGERLLDVGTGSGILSIAAIKLGASEAFACDIDPVAVKVANENFEKNGVADRARCAVSDLLRGVDGKKAPFNFVTANIVADILIRMAPDISPFMAQGARLVASGIIDNRRGDVVAAMTAQGLRVIDEEKENDWCAVVFVK